MSKRIWDVGETTLHAKKLQGVSVVRNKGHTGAALVSKSGCLSAQILSSHLLQTTPAYTSNLGHLVM